MLRRGYRWLRCRLRRLYVRAKGHYHTSLQVWSLTHSGFLIKLPQPIFPLTREGPSFLLSFYFKRNQQKSGTEYWYFLPSLFEFHALHTNQYWSWRQEKESVSDQWPYLLPFRHLCLCFACADSLRFQANNCPICRAPFRALLQVHQRYDTTTFLNTIFRKYILVSNLDARFLMNRSGPFNALATRLILLWLVLNRFPRKVFLLDTRLSASWMRSMVRSARVISIRCLTHHL